MIIYILLFMLSIITILTNSLNYKYLSKISLALMILFMFIIVIFRGVSVGTDYPLYNFFFYSSPDSLKSAYIEKGYIFINIVAQKINNFEFISFVLLLLLLYGLYKLSKQAEINFSIIISVFILTYTFYSSLNIIRQYYAIGFSLIGIYFLFKYLNNNPILAFFLYCITVILAKEFHSSAIFLIMFVIFPFINVTKVKVVFVGLLTMFLYIFSQFTTDVINFIMKFDIRYALKYGNAINVLTDFNQKNVVNLVYLLMQFVIVYFAIDYIKDSYDNRYESNFILSGYLFNLVLYVGGDNVIFSRIQAYTYIFLILFYSKMLTKYRNEKKDIELIKLISIIMLISLYIYRILTNNSGIVPFVFK